MKNLFLGLAASFVLAQFAACGGSECNRQSKCSADSQPTQADITACEEALKNVDTSAKCYAETKAYSDCLVSNQTCGSDNKTDGVATAAKCTTQAEAVTKCQTPAM